MVMSLYNRQSCMFFFYCIIAMGIVALSVYIGVYKRPTTDKIVPEVRPEDESKFIKYENMAKPDEFPYHVSIQFKRNHQCSGALISPKHVLSVAHCVHMLKSTIQDVKVVSGTFIFPGGTTYDVEVISVHPDFDRPTIRSDIAVIRLSQEVTQTDYLKTIQLPGLDQTMPCHQYLIMSGITQFRELPAYTYLTKFTRYVFDKDICDERGQELKTWNLSGKFCAFAVSRYTTQMEDDGSPATVDRKYLIGIFVGPVDSDDGYDPAMPDFFIYVPSYLDFIQKETSKN